MDQGSTERSWVLPDEPVPVRLMATIWADAEGLHDDLAVPADVDEWLDAIGVNRNRSVATREEFLRARELRDAARRLAALVTSDDRPSAASAPLDIGEAIRAVNAIASELPVPQLRLDSGSLRLDSETAAPVAAGLARVAAETRQLLAGDSLALRACHAPGCVLYFVKTHPRREWCSVACGNRVRAARHYQNIRSTHSTR